MSEELADGGTTFDSVVERHQFMLRKRSRSKVYGADRMEFAMAAEHVPPVGQAYLWYRDVIHNVPASGRDVAMQLARLCDQDGQVTLPWRSLSDAVGKADKAGRTRAYAERGVASLVEAEWLRVVTVGRGRGARTTFQLLPGSRRTHRVCRSARQDESCDWAEMAA